jgi:hypothetical protein
LKIILDILLEFCYGEFKGIKGGHMLKELQEKLENNLKEIKELLAKDPYDFCLQWEYQKLTNEYSDLKQRLEGKNIIKVDFIHKRKVA